MKILLLVGFVLGALVVFQPSINRLVLESRGLSFAVMLNAAVLFSLAILFFLAFSYSAERFSSSLRFLPQGPFHWWFMLPGLMGFLLVVFVPLMIKNLGAFPTVITMMLGQITTSFLWDFFAHNAPLHTGRVVGVGLVMLGAYFSFKPNG